MAELPSHQEHTPHQEIAELERLLEEKRQALAAEGKALEEREAFKETFRERYGEALAPPPAGGAPAAPTAASPPAPPADELARHAQALGAKERAEQLEHLIALAFSNGVRYAADVARRATPWLMDELHDRLQDQYYQKLIELKQLKAL